MKRTTLVFSLPFMSLLLASCGSNPTTPDVTRKNIVVHTSKTESGEAEFYFFNKNSDVPYLEINSTVNDFCREEDYSISQSGSLFTITNKITNNTMTLNGDGIVTYPNFSGFRSDKPAADGCYIDEFATTVLTCRKIADKSSYTPSTEYKVDLSKFNFKPVLYEGNYYLPINVLHTLLYPDLGTFYYDAKGEIYLYGVAKDIDSIITKKTSYTKEFYEYCFNQFSLNTELSFGLKGYSRKLRCDNANLNYMPNGVLETFASYKEKIINSKSIDEFDSNMITMLNSTMADGGHTTGYYHSIGSDPKKELPDSEEENYLNGLKKIGEEKREQRAEADRYDYNICSFDTDKDGKDDIGYLTFDSFELVDKVETGAYSIQTLMQGKDGANTSFNKNDDNYDEDEYDIKDVVIDLSLNSGGNVSAEGFLLSWICGGVAQETLRGTNGKALSTYTYNFDVNGDSEYNQKDYLSDDVNVYVLISPYTYSAANSLAYNSYLYNRQSAQTRKVKFIGMQSGGGACSVTNTCYLPSGFSYRLAANDASVDIDNINVACENGVQPDSGLELTFDNIFNRTGANGINQLIVSKRAK